MALMTDIIKQLNSIVWGPLMLVLILGTGLMLMIGLKGMPISKLAYGFKMLWAGRETKTQKGEGDIAPFNALMTSLSATI
ncbi:MAG: sodium:alanine symporter family protein, partial [Pseudomonadota bacterium]|nr:sodium:alanine symporter family protein [Pseudomonadota bacterium]